MSNLKTFKDLIVWQKAHHVVLFVYKITKEFPNEEKFARTDQLRRAAVSISSNIAEGFTMRTAKDKNRFYLMAKASTMECLNQILIARDLNYISENTHDELENSLTEVIKLLTVFMRNSIDHSF